MIQKKDNRKPQKENKEPGRAGKGGKASYSSKTSSTSKTRETSKTKETRTARPAGNRPVSGQRDRGGARPIRQRPKQEHPEGAMRLNKYIAHAGICSRREADELIAAGSVKVNGRVVTEMGYQVMPGDEVQYGGEKLRSERPRYFLLNKPKGFITTTDDPQERRTVMMLMDGCCAERIYPVGRLDRATTGLLLFTNDGELAKRLTHPSTQVYKIYQVELNKPVTKEDMKKLLDGIELEDGPMHVDDIQYAATGSTIDKRIVGVELHSGRNRIVRRLFETLGYEVHKLDRTVFAGLTKKDLPRGRWRELTDKEVGYLKMI
ncbi:MAG: rRNA pseudouridine synthase [Bacteroidales bacterium]|nr:rRNA pseudouridine synthase [Bacteroidales bacterium]